MTPSDLRIASFDAIDTMVWIVDGAFRLLARNEAAYAYGVRKNSVAVVGESLLPHVRDDLRSELVAHVERAAAGERVRYATTTDGGRSFLVGCAPLVDEHGAASGAVVNGAPVVGAVVIGAVELSETRVSKSLSSASPTVPAPGAIAVSAPAASVPAASAPVAGAIAPSGLTDGLAHDFRNFMNVVNLDLALLTELATAEPRLREICAEALTAAGAATALARQLLTLETTDSAFERVDLAQLVEGAQPLIRALAGRMELANRLAPAGPVLARVSLLERVLVHLVRNARDGSSRRGALRIETGVARAGAALTQRDVAMCDVAFVRVIDRGSGIDPLVMPRIFEPGFTTKRRGAGLGLSESRAAARAHGGELYVDSVPGQGATAVLALPLAPPEPHALDLTGVEVWLALEPPSIRKAAERVLEYRGAHVVAVSDPRQVPAATSRDTTRVRVAIVDRVVFGRSGLELAATWRASTDDLRIVLASEAAELIDEARMLGARPLARPFSPAALLEAVVLSAARPR